MTTGTGETRSSLAIPLLLLALSAPCAGATFPVTSAADSGPNTLRQAILDANATSGPDVITFAIGSGLVTITLGSVLPSLDEAVTIDGTTQPGYAGAPLVDVNGNGKSGDGLVITAGPCAVKGLVLRNFHGIGIRLQGGGANVIQSSYVGITADGGSASANTNGGISVESGSTANVIGGITTLGNVISGNGAPGIQICASCSGNEVDGNLVGTNAAGTASIPNTVGIRVLGTLTHIGLGTATRNVISGNVGAGISIEGSASATVQGNFVGTNAPGTAALANGGSGVAVFTDGNTIGGAVAGAGNVISGNTGNGIYVDSGADGNVIAGNLIGTNAAGTAAIPNAGGVRLFASASNTVGGTTAAARNVISGNSGAAISVEQTGGTGNTIAGNFIGLNAAGDAAVANGYGVQISGPSNTVGGTSAGAGNVISANTEGVTLSSNGNLVQGNRVGTNAAGTAALGNGVGIRVLGGKANTIGGTTAAARNVVSGNTQSGITIEGAGATGNLVLGNFVGTDAAGTAAVANNGGVAVLSDNNTIGGAAAGAGNVISGNTFNGILISSASGNTVLGNFVGTTATGAAAVGNGVGIRVLDASSTTIGGTTAAARNVISGSARNVIVDGTSTLTLVQGNFIGPDATGTAAVGGTNGIEVYSSRNTIGGTTAGAGNVISGLERGLSFSSGSHDNVAEGNFIGTRADGLTPLPNTTAGVVVSQAFANQIGGRAVGTGNVISANSSLGVVVVSGNGNSILGNSISGNGSPGIDLNPRGVVVNDALDPDSGPNRQQNFPLLTSAVVNGGNTKVLGTLNSRPNTAYRVEIFGNAACHPSGFGEGRTFLDKTDVTTDGSGVAAISATIGTSTPGAFIAATATDPDGNTSEFSPCAALGGENPGQLQFFSTSSSISEAAGPAVITVVRTGGLTGAVSVHYATSDSTAQQPGDYASASGDLVFADGEVIKTFSVSVVDDGTPESTETVNLTLSGPTAGAVLGAQSTATLSILDYDAANPAVRIADAAVAEGNAGTTTISFDVTMTRHSGTVLVDYTTVDGTALAGLDYVAKSGALSFAPADELKTVDVTVNGETLPETDEVFFVTLTGVETGTLARSAAEGLIANDDVAHRGDANGDGTVNVTDVLYLINNLFAGGPAPSLFCLGDANGDTAINVTDILYLINFLFAGGPAPAPGC